MKKTLWLILVALVLGLSFAACDDDDDDNDDTGGDTDTDTDTDADGDADTDADGDADTDADTDSDADGDADCESLVCDGTFEGEPGEVQCNAYQCQSCELQGYFEYMCELSTEECITCWENFVQCCFDMDCTGEPADVSDQYENGCKGQALEECGVSV